jgi:hypothetical protein
MRALSFLVFAIVFVFPHAYQAPAAAPPPAAYS